MKIIWIERKEETEKYNLTKVKFRTWLGKEFITTCITEKGMSSTKFFDTGEDIPSLLWEPFKAFLETNLDYFQPT